MGGHHEGIDRGLSSLIGGEYMGGHHEGIDRGLSSLIKIVWLVYV